VMRGRHRRGRVSTRFAWFTCTPARSVVHGRSARCLRLLRRGTVASPVSYTVLRARVHHRPTPSRSLGVVIDGVESRRGSPRSSVIRSLATKYIFVVAVTRNGSSVTDCARLLGRHHGGQPRNVIESEDCLHIPLLLLGCCDA